MFSQRRNGISLRPIVEGPSYKGRTNGQVHVVDTSAILNADRLSVFVTNRSPQGPGTVHVSLSDRPIVALDDTDILTGPNAKAANSFAQPAVIRSQPFTDVHIAGGSATIELPPLSVAAMTFRLG
jgi:alpha-N-arabinofuranosidase